MLKVFSGGKSYSRVTFVDSSGRLGRIGRPHGPGLQWSVFKIQTSADCFLGPVSCHVQISSDIVGISRNRASVLGIDNMFLFAG